MESYLPYSSATPPGCILITTGHPSPLIIAGVRCLAPGTGVSSRCVCPSVCYVKLSAPRYSTTWLGSIYKYGMFYPRETPVICRDLIAVIMHIYFPPWRRFCISRPKQVLMLLTEHRDTALAIPYIASIVWPFRCIFYYSDITLKYILQKWRRFLNYISLSWVISYAYLCF